MHANFRDLACGLVAAIGLCAPAATALAQATAVLASPKSSSITITMTLTVSTALGTSADSDTKVVESVAIADGRFFVANPPWTSTQFDGFLIDPADMDFHFDLFCFPFLGCQAIDIALTDFVLLADGPMSSPMSTQGVFSFPEAPFTVFGNYAVSGLAASSGILANTVATTLGGRVQALDGNLVRVDQMTLAPVTVPIDPASLPAGVNAMTVGLAVNLATLPMEGIWGVQNPQDLDGDGLVAAGDLAILLGAWGSSGAADFDANGSVGASDLAILLGAWSS
jgi:hypothetical protein